MQNELTVKNMNDLTAPQFAALQVLMVSENQEVLGKSFTESIEDWESAPQDDVLGLCFLLEDQPIGLSLFMKHPANTASIHGLKIAIPWQRQGFGHSAFGLAVDQLKVAWPNVKRLKLAVDAENIPAVTIYKAFGMNDSGPVFQGPNGMEHRMDLQFKP